MAEGNGYATREMLLGGGPKPRRYADVIIQGRKFRLRSLTSRELNLIQAKYLVEDDHDEKVEQLVATNCRWIVNGVCDGNGDSLFGDQDVAELLELDAAFVNALAKAVQDHCGVEPQAVENAEKNSVATAA